jgi:hypothetical protein
MIRISETFIRLWAVTIVAAAALFWNGQLPLNPNTALVSSAEARIGRPLTPLSYAGVARRTTRRAITYGAAAGAVAYGAAVAAPVVVAPAGRCVQAVDPYGRVYTRCY